MLEFRDQSSPAGMLELLVESRALSADQTATAGLLRTGAIHDTAGRLDAAAAAYEQAIAAAPHGDGCRVEAMRRLGVIRQRRGDPKAGREFCTQSYREALRLGDLMLAGEALNALAGFELETGQMAGARSGLLSALALASNSPALLGRIEQNLGTIARVQGDHEGALAHYRRALESFRQVGDDSGCAHASHHLGVTASRRGDLEEAERSLTRSAALAGQLGDLYLRSLCELHRAELAHARRQYPDALTRAEAALAGFERLDDRRSVSAAQRVIGTVLRDSGRGVVAEERLRAAIAIAVQTGWVLGQAEAARELARLHRANGQKQEALALFREAYDLFGRLAARLDLRDVAQSISELTA